MGSACYTIHKEIVSQSRCDTEIPEEEGLINNNYIIQGHFIESLDKKQKTITSKGLSSDLIQQLTTQEMLDNQNQKEYFKFMSSQPINKNKKGILKNKNVHLQEEMQLLSLTQQYNNEEYEWGRLASYLTVRRKQFHQQQYEINFNF